MTLWRGVFVCTRLQKMICVAHELYTLGAGNQDNHGVCVCVCVWGGCLLTGYRGQRRTGVSCSITLSHSLSLNRELVCLPASLSDPPVSPALFLSWVHAWLFLAFYMGAEALNSCPQEPRTSKSSLEPQESCFCFCFNNIRFLRMKQFESATEGF